MMGGGGCRISHHIRGCNYLQTHQYESQSSLGLGLGLGLGFGLYSSSVKIVHFSSSSSPLLKPSPLFFTGGGRHRFRFQRQLFSSSNLQSKSPADSISHSEDDFELPSEGLSPVAGGIVALGKFDALHIGHRELVIQASKIGTPYLLSFIGMAEILGWEPRAPIVAKCDRKRVLSTWTPFCGNVVPKEYQIQFASVRHLSPSQFVEKLSKELGVCGVVAGENYRFGYKATGDASELVRLCEEYGMDACIISSVMDKKQDSGNTDSIDSKDKGQVSSTRVRRALAKGDIAYVSELLGRQHRLVATVKEGDIFLNSDSSSKTRLSVCKSCLLNLAPKENLYENCSLLYGADKTETCKVLIDPQYLHLEFDRLGPQNFDEFQNLQFLSIEFGD